MTTKKAAPRARSKGWKTLEVVDRDGVLLVGLNRPDVHNAFDETLIAELTSCIETAGGESSVRAIVLHGAGKSFCAGADLDWMRRMAGYGRAENLADANALARMLRTLAECPKPTIARVHGPAYGGGVGLVACCDVAIGAHDAVFALSEVKLGLIPATISPYVVAAIGERHARRYFVTAERFDAGEAYRIGLLHELVTADALDTRVNEVLGAMLLGGPWAQSEAKTLVRAVANRPVDDELVADTAARIATVRAGAEAREGVGAFLERRPAAWIPPALRPAPKASH